MELPIGQLACGVHRCASKSAGAVRALDTVDVPNDSGGTARALRRRIPISDEDRELSSYR